MNDLLIYLCGPINGCNDEECKDWRNEVKQRYPEKTIDPMDRDYRGREDECINEIVELDKIDIADSDIILVNHPKPSVGTSMEILYAWQLSKTIIVVYPEGMKLSPWLVYHSDYRFTKFQDAYNILDKLLIKEL